MAFAVSRAKEAKPLVADWPILSAQPELRHMFDACDRWSKLRFLQRPGWICGLNLAMNR